MTARVTPDDNKLGRAIKKRITGAFGLVIRYVIFLDRNGEFIDVGVTGSEGSEELRSKRNELLLATPKLGAVITTRVDQTPEGEISWVHMVEIYDDLDQPTTYSMITWNEKTAWTRVSPENLDYLNKFWSQSAKEADGS